MNLSEYRLFKLYCENIIEEAEEKCNKHYYSIKKYFDIIEFLLEHNLLEQGIENLCETIEQHEDLVNNLETEVDSLQDDVGSLQFELEDALAELEFKDSLISELEEKLDKLQNKYEE